MNCTLERMADQHAAAILALTQHPGIALTSSVPPDCGMAQVMDWIAGNNALPVRTLTFAVLLGSTPVGAVTLKKLGLGDKAGELAFWIGVPYQKRGLARVAGDLALDHAFGQMSLDHVHAHFLAENNPFSAKVLESLRFYPDPARSDLPTASAGGQDRFALAFPHDCWRFVRLDRSRR